MDSRESVGESHREGVVFGKNQPLAATLRSPLVAAAASDGGHAGHNLVDGGNREGRAQDLPDLQMAVAHSHRQRICTQQHLGGCGPIRCAHMHISGHKKNNEWCAKNKMYSF